MFWQIPLLIALSLLMGKLVVSGLPAYYLFGGFACALIAFITFSKPKAGLVVLVFSMMLSPELRVGQAGNRPITVRYDDMLLVTVFLAWLANTTVRKSVHLLKLSPIHLPVFFYAFSAILSTSVAIMRGDLVFIKSFFYVLKYIEYLFLFFMAVNIIETKRDAGFLLKCGLVTAVLVTLYAYNYHFRTGDRTTAPFDDPLYGLRTDSEPGTLGAYYLIVFGLLTGLITEVGGRGFAWAVGLLLFMFPSFLMTLSRASYLGVAAVALTIFFFARKRRMLILLCGVAISAIALATPQIRETTVERVNLTFHGGKNRTLHDFTFFGYHTQLEDSAAQRVWAWERILFKKFPRHPVIGHGVTGIGFEDTQFGLILGEMGLVGFSIFIWLLVSLYRLGFAAFESGYLPWEKGIALGYVAGLSGLIVHALTSNTFIIVKVMQPFWLLTAIVCTIYLSNREGEKEETA